MKVRNGFVSNSSTSSFCIVGRTLADGEKLDPKRNYAAIGKQLDGGAEVFDLTKDMVKLLNEADNIKWAEDNDLEIYEVAGADYDDGSCFISIKQMEAILKDCKARGLDGVAVRYGECDQNQRIEDVKAFKRIYIDGIEDGAE